MESLYRIIKTKNTNAIIYYIRICNNLNISIRELRNRIKTKEYERLSESAKAKLIANEQSLLPDLVKNPILIKNTNKYNEISEKILQ